ncbi:hypothetical protein [Nostoc sp.]
MTTGALTQAYWQLLNDHSDESEIAHPKDEADKGTSSVQVPNSPFI